MTFPARTLAFANGVGPAFDRLHHPNSANSVQSLLSDLSVLQSHRSVLTSGNLCSSARWIHN